jgi:hypothetical protein
LRTNGDGYGPIGNGFTFEKLDVQSGTFQCQAPPADSVRTYIGTANEIHVAAGAQITNDNAVAQTLSSVLTGKGTMNFGSTLTVTPGMVDHSSVLTAGKYVRDGSDLRLQAAGIKPGDSVGVLTINDNLAFSNYAGTNYPFLEIEVVGGNQGPGEDFDQLVVGGTVTGMPANLDLTIKFADALIGTNVLNGDELTIIDSSANTLAWGLDIGATLFRSVTWVGGTGKIKVPDQSGTGFGSDVILYDLAPAGLPGDADLNGYVDLPDLVLLARNWHASPATWGQGNFDGDTIVDLPDLVILARNWHEGTIPPASGGAVPEPASAVLLLAGLGVLARRRRRG